MAQVIEIIFVEGKDPFIPPINTWLNRWYHGELGSLVIRQRKMQKNNNSYQF